MERYITADKFSRQVQCSLFPSCSFSPSPLVMLLRLGTQAFTASTFILASVVADCNPLAVSLPFKSNVLSNRVEVRGIQLRIGGPSAQTIALLPSASLNDTYLYGAANSLCKQLVPNSTPQKFVNFSIEECTTFRGGLYDIELSGSKTVGISEQHPYDNTTATWIADDVTIMNIKDQGLDLPQLAFGIRAGTSHPYVNKGELGLGIESTFLSTLASRNQIASKTYSFFWGTDSTISDKPRNGSLTLGGYDEALIGDSPNTTTTFTRNNWKCREGMVVELTGIGLNSVTGTAQHVLKSERLQACVVPTLSSILTLPYQYWVRMHDILGVEQTPFNNGSAGELLYGVASVYPNTATFKGNLSISINDEITVNIPNELFIVDEPYTVNNGQIRRSTVWKDIPVVSYLDLEENMPRLGGMFLSSAYLMVDHDKNEFTIAPVQVQPMEQKLMGIDTTNACVAAVDGAVVTVPGPSPEKPSDAHGKTANRLSSGAIAGIFVGVLALVCVLIGTTLFLRRRRLSRHDANPHELHKPVHMGHVADPLVPEKYGMNATELPAGSYSSEMSADERQHALELDGISRLVEVPANRYEGDRH